MRRDPQNDAAEPVSESLAQPGRNDRSQRSSLRREWTRAFSIMLALSLLAGVTSFAVLGRLVGDFSGAAMSLSRESRTTIALDAALVDHEHTGHKLLATPGRIADPTGFLREQDRISQLFDAALPVFPPASRTILLKARTEWKESLADVGLWGDQVNSFTGPKNDLNPVLGAEADIPRSLLASLQKPSMAAMDRQLANAGRLKTILMAGLAIVVLIGLGVTGLLRRRLSTRLLKPIGALSAGVSRLRSGEFDHRVALGRRDELGALAEAFNGMAQTISDNHQELTVRATHDSLTELPNRAQLRERVGQLMKQPNRSTDRPALMFVDLDDFKTVNDGLGHQAGDQLLIAVARRLHGCVRGEDWVARLGGDEFAILIEKGAASPSRVTEIAQRTVDALQAPFTIQGQALFVQASIGIAFDSGDYPDQDALLRDADIAMYMAKANGKNRFEVFHDGMHDPIRKRMDLQAGLRHAIDSGEIAVHYQPIVHVETGKLAGLEALVRWDHPERGVLPPSAFLDIAEGTGLIVPIGKLVLDKACKQLAAWQQMPDGADLSMSVNLSSSQIRADDIVEDVRAAIKASGINPKDLIIEVTESVLTSDVNQVAECLRSIKGLGVRIAIDDFGTGYSSISQLRLFSADIIKIDKSFIDGITHGPEAAGLAKAIVKLGQTLGLDTVAEGIEWPEQQGELQKLGCTYAQGYYFARPSDAGTISDLLVSSHIQESILDASGVYASGTVEA